MLPAGRPYLALLRVGFQRQTAYRLALAAGLTTNAFFGIVRTAIFYALYRERDQVAGLDVAELLRPGDPYLRLLAFDLGRTLSVLLTRTVPTLTVAALLLPLRLPGTLGGLALLGASLVLAAVVSFQLRFLFSSAAFWTPDYRSLFLLVFPVLWLAPGFVVPVDFFPGTPRALVDLSPLIPLLMAPVRVAIGAPGRPWPPRSPGWRPCGWPAAWSWPWPAGGWWSTVAEGTAVYLRLAAASVRATARRPVYLAARSLAAAMIVAIEVAGVVLMLDRFGSIGGWRPPEVLLLFGLAFTAQGVALMFGDTLEADKMSELVRRGTFDQVLTRPASPLGWVVASYVDTRFLGRSLAGAATVLWTTGQAGVDWTPWRAGLAVLAVACAASIIFGVLMASAGFTFLTVQASEAVNVLLYGGQYLASYPMQIYGSALRFVFVWVVPLGLAIYVPALGILGREGPPGLPAWLAWLSAPVAAAFLSLGGLAWRAGIRHYVGTGS